MSEANDAKRPVVGRTIADVCQHLSRDTPYGEASLEPMLDAWWSAFCRWPPNVFALTSVLLKDSGAYRLAVSPPGTNTWPPPSRGAESWNAFIKALATDWRDTALPKSSAPVPAELTALGKTLCAAAAVTVRAIAEERNWPLASAILEMHAASDAACAGFGVRPDPTQSGAQVELRAHANDLLARDGTLAKVPRSIIQVLPKFRTPQTGITLRSLSHHLAVNRSEVDIDYRFAPLCEGEPRRLNVVVLPWPLEIAHTAFKPVRGPVLNMDEARFGFFEFETDTRIDVRYVHEMIDAAQKRVDQVHGVVFPEGALTEHDVEVLKPLLATRGVQFLLAGVRGPELNYAHFATRFQKGEEAGETLLQWREYKQHKHHRWFLDESQIGDYHLSMSLHPNVKWWENMRVERRNVNFVIANGWLAICPLICEDLARQDPVAPVIRALGPTLVIALLLDGPQLSFRWPARYATVLADDPGTSVLTVTALGMALRCRPQGKAVERCVGLWRDSKTGTRQLMLGPQARGLVLTMCADWMTEYTADGRSDGETAARLVLTEVQELQ